MGPGARTLACHNSGEEALRMTDFFTLFSYDTFFAIKMVLGILRWQDDHLGGRGIRVFTSTIRRYPSRQAVRCILDDHANRREK